MSLNHHSTNCHSRNHCVTGNLIMSFMLSALSQKVSCIKVPKGNINFSNTLDALKQQVFSFELIEVIGVDDEDSIAEDESKDCTNDEGFPSVVI